MQYEGALRGTEAARGILRFQYPAEGRLGGFQVLAIMNWAALDICVLVVGGQKFLNTFGQKPRSTIDGSYI